MKPTKEQLMEPIKNKVINQFGDKWKWEELEPMIDKALSTIQQETEKDLVEKIDKYFENIIIVTDPQKTKVSLINSLTQENKEKV